MCMNSRADTVMTDETVNALWQTLIVDRWPTLDPISALDPVSVWIGFVIGLERYDLAKPEACPLELLPSKLTKKSRF
jgi:hypothetical protein